MNEQMQNTAGSGASAACERFVVRHSGRDWTFVLIDDRGETLMKGGMHSTRAFALAAVEEVRALLRSDAAIERSYTPRGRYTFAVRTPDQRRMAVGNFYSSVERRDRVVAECRTRGCAAVIAEELEPQAGNVGAG